MSVISTPDSHFDSLSFQDARPLALFKKAILVFLAAFLTIGAISTYRAYYQIHSLELRSPERILHSGSTIQTTVVTYGRTWASVQIQIIQGAHSETLAVQHVPKNLYGFFDPRTQHASQTLVLTPEILARFQVGAAQVRATALGGQQWTRTPPPIVRELSVEIQHG